MWGFTQSSKQLLSSCFLWILTQEARTFWDDWSRFLNRSDALQVLCNSQWHIRTLDQVYTVKMHHFFFYILCDIIFALDLVNVDMKAGCQISRSKVIFFKSCCLSRHTDIHNIHLTDCSSWSTGMVCDNETINGSDSDCRCSEMVSH